MGGLVRKSHDVSPQMCHIVCVAKCRRLVIADEAGSALKPVCIEISKRYEIRFQRQALNLVMSIFWRNLFRPVVQQ